MILKILIQADFLKVSLAKKHSLQSNSQSQSIQQRPTQQIIRQNNSKKSHSQGKSHLRLKICLDWEQTKKYSSQQPNHKQKTQGQI